MSQKSTYVYVCVWTHMCECMRGFLGGGESACGWWRCSHSKQSEDIIWVEWETVSMMLASV